MKKNYKFLIAVFTVIFLCKNDIVLSQNNALNFDGANDNIIINNSPSLDFSINSNFSIEAWFNKTSFSDGEIFSKMANSSPYTGYEMYVTGPGKIAFLFINTWISNCIWLQTTNSFNDGLWHHVALIYKGIPNAANVDIYVDGVIQTKTVTYNSLSGPTNTINKAGIAARDGNGYFYNGAIDEVRVWNKSLCVSEITGHKNCNLIGNESGLVAYYNFNQGVAGANNTGITTLTDLTINNNTGTLTSMTLNGPTSNWITSGASIVGICGPVGPTVTVSGNTLICAGFSTTLTASGASTYTWTAGPINANYIVNPVINTTYTVTGTDVSGCQNLATKTVSITPSPTINISGATIICSGQSSSLTASGANTYTWTGGPATPGYLVSPLINTTYTVTGTNISGCMNTSVKTVTVNPSPTLSISGNATVCAGQSTTLTANGAVTYTWNTGSNSSTVNVTPSVTTTYTASGTSGLGCSGSATKIITVNPLPIITMNFAPIDTQCVSVGSVSLSPYATPVGGTFSGTWVFGNSFSPAAAGPGTYTVTYTYTNVNNCTNSGSKTINVLTCTGINILNLAEKFMLYPNPNHGEFSVELQNHIGKSSIVILNTLGQTLLIQELGNGINYIKAELLSKGIYQFIVLEDKTVINSGKLVIE